MAYPNLRRRIVGLNGTDDRQVSDHSRKDSCGKHLLRKDNHPPRARD